MKQRGRKSAAKLSVAAPIGDISRPKAPASLDKSAAALWDRVLAIYPQNYFNAADLELLREFCFTSATLIPVANSEYEKFPNAAALRTRSMLVKEAATIATKLRLCVSSRTRGDAAAIRNAGKPQVKPWGASVVRAEELPHRRSTEYLFNGAVAAMIKAGKTRCCGLQGKDVIGVYVACAVALARKNFPDLDMAHLLRAAADVLDEKETTHDQAVN